MAEGITNLPYYKNEKTGTLQMWEGTPALDNLISTAGADIKKTITIEAKKTVTLMSDNPFLVLDAGIVTGQAGTADFIQTTMTYFERKA
jgi:hypothetical protein